MAEPDETYLRHISDDFLTQLDGTGDDVFKVHDGVRLSGMLRENQVLCVLTLKI